jgi:hypothetical protein
VTVNGRNAGKTPLSVEVPGFSRVMVKVTLAGYKPFEQGVTTRMGRGANKLVATLEKEPPPKPAPLRPGPKTQAGSAPPQPLQKRR